ncbi:hypothetical protein NDU88_008880 [Pleurodeles waltl]|uniref:Uncharacterized protein n=1 Tax=Pleurodeles waltl TaxID=8319 RepID=A0AAV7PRP2_PLEWA|nr:hypothetical protein NDU88_008880 [Pleurodeles waltl]
MAGTQGRKGSPGALASGWARGQRQVRGLPPRGLPEPWPRAPELKPEGEASPGPADSQARAPWGTAGWRRGSPAPGPVGAQLGPLNPKRQGKPPLAQRTPRPGPLWIRQAARRDHLSQGSMGALPEPLHPNRQGKPPRALWTLRPGSLSVRQAGARERPPQGLMGAQWDP